jgi:hypothetical protein
MASPIDTCKRERISAEESVLVEESECSLFLYGVQPAATGAKRKELHGVNKETIAMQKQEQLAPKTSVLVKESECSCLL